MDRIQKKAGVPYSTSRSWEKAMKKKTHKKRRQILKKRLQNEC